MKKIFLIGLAATAVLTGCSKDETMEMASQKAIGFETFVNKSTRAVDNDVTNNTIEAFKVYGFLNTPAAKVFDGTKVTGSYGKTWSYTPEQYWTTGGKYWFAAVACLQMKDATYTSDAYTLTWSDKLNDEKCYGADITFDNSKAKAEQDLVYAFNGARTDGTPVPEAGSGYTAATSESDNTAVPFNFKHLLSRVKFVFKNDGGNDQTILRITGLKITNAYERGSISTDQTSGKGIEESGIAWSGNDADLEVVFDPQDIAGNDTGTGATADDDYRYLIPGQSEFVITFTAQFFAADGKTELGEDKTFTFDGVSGHLPKVTIGKETDSSGNEVDKKIRKGYSYVFKASLSRKNVEEETLSSIQFTVESVKDWVTEEETETTTEFQTTAV